MDGRRGSVNRLDDFECTPIGRGCPQVAPSRADPPTLLAPWRPWLPVAAGILESRRLAGAPESRSGEPVPLSGSCAALSAASATLSIASVSLLATPKRRSDARVRLSGAFNGVSAASVTLADAPVTLADASVTLADAPVGRLDAPERLSCASVERASPSTRFMTTSSGKLPAVERVSGPSLRATDAPEHATDLPESAPDR